MLKYRDNIFYFSAIVGLLAWIVNTVAVMRICGITHPILLREIFFLAILLGTFYFYAQKKYEDIDTVPFHGRAEVSKGDVLIFRFLGPWLLLVWQLLLTSGMLTLTNEKLFSDGNETRFCEYRRR